MSFSEKVTTFSDVGNIQLAPELIFPFSLDAFQIEAMQSLNQGFSVVVSAPTGSGKTLVGEYAIHRALSHRQKVFYVLQNDNRKITLYIIASYLHLLVQDDIFQKLHLLYTFL